jgi:hypothetical protein
LIATQIRNFLCRHLDLIESNVIKE